MITDLKPYPVMNDSGVEWLGEVPEHWEVRRIKTLFREKDERSRDGCGVLLSLTRVRGIVPQAQASNRMASAEDLSKYKVCRPGDLVMNRMQAWSGMFALSPLKGVVSPDYSVFGATQSASVKYFEHLFKTPIWVGQFAQRSKGIGSGFNRLYTDDFGAVPVVSPPLSEQAAIVRFLDHVDRLVRRYVRAKQKLIGLLEEQKQVIIHRAVTRGLDPDVPLKPSGVEWLGDVPEHWEVVRLKNLVSRVTSGSRGWSNYAADEGVLFIRIGNLTRASIGLDMGNVVRLQLPDAVRGEALRTRVRGGDVLLSITAFIGSVALVPADIEEAYVSQHVACCRPIPAAANEKWIAYVLLSSVGQIHGHLSMYGGTKQGLSLDDVKDYIILLPPVEEQLVLVDWIETATSSVDAAISSARHEIELLREYRTRLIADVVTGKLDVREAAADLPDEPEEREPLEEADDLMDEGEAMSDDLDTAPKEAEV